MIKFECVNKTYGGTNPVYALADVNMELDTGCYVAISGPSGSGKSTLLNIMGCLDTPSSGSYTLFGSDVSKLGITALAKLRARHIGFVFQSFNLISRMSALENVELPMIYSGVSPRYRREKAKETLCLLGLENRLSHKPSELSGGQCQRVAIARALVNDPDIILADEPTGNLDPHTSEEIICTLENLNKAKKSIIIITHEPEVARRASQQIILTDGKINV